MSAREAIPMHQSRPTTPGARGRPQSDARKAVEAVLRTATREKPLTPAEVAARCGMSLSITYVHIGRIVYRGLAHNCTHIYGNAKFAWGADPSIFAKKDKPRDEFAPPASQYDGRELRPYSGRPGAMDAFTLPSLQNGQRVERKAPTIIAATGGLRMVTARSGAAPTDIFGKDRK